jgi:hypothetical protein
MKIEAEHLFSSLLGEASFQLEPKGTFNNNTLIGSVNDKIGTSRGKIDGCSPFLEVRTGISPLQSQPTKENYSWCY